MPASGWRPAGSTAGNWGRSAAANGPGEAAGTLGGTTVKLLKPTTYMNRSGAALAPLRALPDFDPAQHLLVLVDDVALPTGTFRLRGAGSAGGHNGLKSIEGALQRQDYARLRIGVGPKPAEIDDLADDVLAEFTPEERQTLEGLLDPMAEAVECWLAEGVERRDDQVQQVTPLSLCSVLLRPTGVRECFVSVSSDCPTWASPPSSTPSLRPRPWWRTTRSRPSSPTPASSRCRIPRLDALAAIVAP